MKLAFLFPGQGAQKVGMGRALAEAYPEARAVFARADETLGFSLSRLCWQGPDAELVQTSNAQPALLAHSIAALRVLEAAGFSPSFAAGHSLGEYSACVAAGALGFEDALRLVQERGHLMQLAGRDRPGAMAAILGLDVPTVEAVCAAASTEGIVVPANLNAPGQVVISGDTSAVEKAREIAKERGARRVIPLEVSGAFHSPLMGPATVGLQHSISARSFSDPRCPVITNITGRPTQRGDDLKAALGSQLLGAVRWEESMRTLVAAGVDAFIEVGTGRVLRGLLRTVAPDAVVHGTDDPDAMAATLAALTGSHTATAGGATP